MTTATITQDAPTLTTEPTGPLAEAAARIVVRHPHLAAMAAAALDVAEHGRIHRLSETRAFVQSPSGKEYRLDYDHNTHGWRCNCPAYAYRAAAINGRHYCKHVMALALIARAQTQQEN